MIRPVAVATAILLSAGAFAANPVGTWTGKFRGQLPPIPARAAPAGTPALAKIEAQMKAAKFILIFKADKTYIGKTVGFPSAPPDEAGTWSQAGNVLTIVHPRAGQAPQKLTMSADGKTMTMTFPGGRGKVVLTR